MGQTEQQLLLQRAQQAGGDRRSAPGAAPAAPPHIQAEIHQQQQDMRQRGGIATAGRPPAAPERAPLPAQVQQNQRRQELPPQAIPGANETAPRRHDAPVLPGTVVQKPAPLENAPAQPYRQKFPGLPPGAPADTTHGRYPDTRTNDGRLPDGRLPDGRVPDPRLQTGRLPNGQLPDGRYPNDDQDHRRRDPGRIVVIPGLPAIPGLTGQGDQFQHRRPPEGYPPTGQPTYDYDPNRGRIQTFDPRQQPLENFDPRRGRIQQWDSGQQPFYGQDRRPYFGDNRRQDWEPWDGRRHRFDSGLDFRPPEGNGWGWQDPNRFSRGWDQWFFQQDPNYENWQPTMNQESQAVTSLLDNGDTRSAADALNADLWQMKGDIYAQNQLLSQVRDTQSGDGATLYLGDWNPDRGTWDRIEVVSPKPAPGYEADPSYMLQTF